MVVEQTWYIYSFTTSNTKILLSIYLNLYTPTQITFKYTSNYTQHAKNSMEVDS
jgi:hypothetical protein